MLFSGAQDRAAPSRVHQRLQGHRQEAQNPRRRGRWCKGGRCWRWWWYCRKRSGGRHVTDGLRCPPTSSLIEVPSALRGWQWQCHPVRRSSLQVGWTLKWNCVCSLRLCWRVDLHNISLNCVLFVALYYNNDGNVSGGTRIGHGHPDIIFQSIWRMTWPRWHLTLIWADSSVVGMRKDLRITFTEQLIPALGEASVHQSVFVN